MLGLRGKILGPDPVVPTPAHHLTSAGLRTAMVPAALVRVVV